jgi:pyrimidine-specific ribonucleoside hydrolase
MKITPAWIAILLLLQSSPLFAQRDFAVDFDAWTRLSGDPAGRFNYGRLAGRFLQLDTTLSDEELALLSFGYTLQPRYDPYGQSLKEDTLFRLFREEKLDEALQYGETYLKENPVSLRGSLGLALVTDKLERAEEYERYRTRFLQLLRGVLSTGTGRSVESAYVVINVRDEYVVLNYLDYTSSLQTLVEGKKGRFYDRLEAVSRRDTSERRDFYFDVTMPFNSLLPHPNEGAHRVDERALIIDTDAGGDDLMAIAFLLSKPELRIEAITVSNGLAHVPQGARNMLRLLKLTGREEIPVFLGRPTPLHGQAAFPEEWRRTTDSLPAVDLPQSSRASERRPAAAYLTERLSPAHPKACILALGPLTNLGEVLQKAPQCASAIEEIVISGGAVDVPGNLGDGGYYKTANTAAEWNMFVDPVAADAVFRSGAKITLVPLDASTRVPIDLPFLQAFRDSARSPAARLVLQILESNRLYIEQGIYFAWDPLAASVLADPEVVTLQQMAIQVELNSAKVGRTIRQPGVGNVSVALEPRVDRFRRTFLGAFGIR